MHPLISSLRINFDTAATRIAVLDDTNLSSDAFAHGIGMTDDPDLLPLRSLKHGQRIDDRGKCIGIQCAEAFVDKEIPKRDTPR